MRFATILHSGNERTGVLHDNALHLLPAGVTLLELLERDGVHLAEIGDDVLSHPAEVVPLETAELLAPLPRPASIRDFYAFEQHVRAARANRGLEMEPDWYELPVFYFTNPHAVFGPGARVPAAPGTARLDYELEVAAVIGRSGSNLSPDEAEGCIAGYLVMNDWSARDLQMREMRLSLGPAKGKDFATSLGPYLVTPDELDGTGLDLAMTATVNGELFSSASLADLYWSFGEMIAYASRGTEVVPGDVIGSGTCGTGCILELAATNNDRYRWLAPGDVVSCHVERLGTLTNTVLAAPEVVPLRARRP
jgi:2-keto-4-pentenoate hydratase/2-oxohepta-3-ene-1,7-dioic acid hydratase in catechol pathway